MTLPLTVTEQSSLHDILARDDASQYESWLQKVKWLSR